MKGCHVIVSSQKMNYQPVAPSEKKQYYETLTQAAEERERAKQLEKLRERQESNRVTDQRNNT